MFRFWILSSLTTILILLTQTNGSSIIQDNQISEIELLDEIDRRPYFINETSGNQNIATLKELEYRKMARSLIDDIEAKCNLKHWYEISCCAGVVLFNQRYKVCLSIDLNLNYMTVNFHLTLNGESVGFYQVFLTKFTLHFPAFPKLSVTIHFYYFDFNKSPITVKSCVSVILVNAVEMNFYCLKFGGNKGLIREDDIVHNTTTPFLILFKKDKVVIKFNVDIPEEILTMVGDMAKYVGDRVMVFVDKAKKKVVNTVNKIGNALRKTFRIG